MNNSEPSPICGVTREGAIRLLPALTVRPSPVGRRWRRRRRMRGFHPGNWPALRKSTEVVPLIRPLCGHLLPMGEGRRLWRPSVRALRERSRDPRRADRPRAQSRRLGRRGGEPPKAATVSRRSRCISPAQQLALHCRRHKAGRPSGRCNPLRRSLSLAHRFSV